LCDVNATSTPTTTSSTPISLITKLTTTLPTTRTTTAVPSTEAVEASSGSDASHVIVFIVIIIVVLVVVALVIIGVSQKSRGSQQQTEAPLGMFQNPTFQTNPPLKPVPQVGVQAWANDYEDPEYVEPVVPRPTSSDSNWAADEYSIQDQSGHQTYETPTVSLVGHCILH